MEINKVIICGLGAVGLTYAKKLKDFCELKILADENRVNKYRKIPPLLNGQKVLLDYITPDESWDADLIIISTKSNGLDDAISYIKNFVKNDTIIISLLNGITSEEKIAEIYGKDKILYSYFIGHSAVRTDNSVTQDGIGKIVFGGEKERELEKFFIKLKIDYEIPKDIIYSMWLKFGVNIYLNQLSAIMNLTMGEMKRNKNFLKFSKNLLKEVKLVAEYSGVKNLDNYEREALNAINLMCENGKTSMLQDILAKRKTEVELFSGEILKRAEQFGITTPYNETVYNMVRILEEKNQ